MLSIQASTQLLSFLRLLFKDVDDKIIIKMASEKKSLKEITELYTNAFFEDLSVLNIVKAREYPRATEHINEIEMMINRLIGEYS